MIPERAAEFQDERTAFLYSTNNACRAKNTERLNALGSPIVLLSAEHDESKSASKSAYAARNLQRHLICSVGSKVILLRNVSLPLGLVNGVIIDFIYTITKAPELPAFMLNSPLRPSKTFKKWWTSVVGEFNDYKSW